MKETMTKLGTVEHDETISFLKALPIHIIKNGKKQTETADCQDIQDSVNLIDDVDE